MQYEQKNKAHNTLWHTARTEGGEMSRSVLTDKTMPSP